MNQYTIGIDNGASGSIGIIGPFGSIFDFIPTKDSLLGKAGKVVKRIDHRALSSFIALHTSGATQCAAYVERPFTGKFANAVLPGQRAFEAVLIVLEQLVIGFQVVDSREWQKPLLGDVKGSPQLKKASLLRGTDLYPQHAAAIKEQGDADGLLIAHHFHYLR